MLSAKKSRAAAAVVTPTAVRAAAAAKELSAPTTPAAKKLGAPTTPTAKELDVPTTPTAKKLDAPTGCTAKELDAPTGGTTLLGSYPDPPSERAGARDAAVPPSHSSAGGRAAGRVAVGAQLSGA